MGGVPVKHHSKSKVGRRRSQIKLEKNKIEKCLNCEGPILSHRVCPNCGFYSRKKK